MELDVYAAVTGARSPHHYQLLLETALSHIGMTPSKQWRDQLSLAFVGETRMKRLSATYAGKQHSADVLSFDYGEVVVCVPSARRQARRHGVAIARELDMLFVHGLLHLFGFDHEKNKDLVRMQMMEERILGATGLITMQGYPRL
ncbi:MAG: rRNA maturation RNase YbeY [Patescibacteria group bacterium]|jgi:probable rRNA maturation factor